MTRTRVTCMPALTPEQWLQVETAYLAVVDAPPSVREDSVRTLRAHAPEIAGEVAAMLALRDTATEFLCADGLQLMARATAAAQTDDDDADGLEPGSVIGHYRITRLIGRGGMGSVYLAERTLAGVVQQVALKRIRRTLNQAVLVERFQREQRLLASLDHPGIARLLDVGTDPRAGPYLVMEFVDGTRLDRFAAQHNLSMPARVELMACVCDVVHAAHQRLVVHRDLKPANVLVTRDGVIKLVDFGTSGVLQGSETRESGPAAVTPLTPAYASPEQLRGAPISTSADIYSLGVIAHELFTGHLPSEQPQRVPRGWRGDLQSIVAHALNGDPARRYAGADAMADDLRRHLRHEPIACRKHALHEHLWKFAQRHRGAAAAAALVAVALTAALIATTWAAIRAQRAEARAQVALKKAETEAAVATAFNDFVVLMLSAPSPSRRDPEGRLPRDVRVIDVLAEAELALPALATQPLAKARVCAFLATTYSHLGENDRAVQLFAEAYASQSQELGADDPIALTMLDSQASAMTLLGRGDEALPLLERVLKARQRTLGPTHEETLVSLNNIAQAHAQMGRFQHALAHFTQVVDLRRASDTLHTRDGLATLDNLALALVQLGRADEALAPQSEARDGFRTLLGAEHPDSIQSLGNSAYLLFALGRFEEAAKHYEQAVEQLTSLTTPDNPRVLAHATNLAACYDRLGHSDRAIETLRVVIAALPEDGSNRANVRAQAMHLLAQSLRRTDRLDESAEAYLQAIHFFDLHLPPGAVGAAIARGGFGSLLLELDRAAEAEPLLQSSVAVFLSTFGQQHARTQTAIADLVRALDANGQREQAAEWTLRLEAASQDK